MYPFLYQIKITNLNYEIILKIMNLLFENKITSSKTKELVSDYLKNGNVKFENKIKKISEKKQLSEKEIENLIIKFIDEKLKNEYKNRPERVRRFMMGKLMKETNGQLNPKLADSLIVKIIEKWIK